MLGRGFTVLQGGTSHLSSLELSALWHPGVSGLRKGSFVPLLPEGVAWGLLWRVCPQGLGQHPVWAVVLVCTEAMLVFVGLYVGQIISHEGECPHCTGARVCVV